MFELSILRKYLIPRRRQLSVTLIAFVSVAVITAVVWLVLLFLSVTEGIEKTWLKKLTSLHAPIRITPTNDYYESYHYLADTMSHKTGYTARSLSEKLKGGDLYDPETDESLPSYIPAPERNPDGTVRDPASLAMTTLQSLKREWKDLDAAPFEMSGAVLRLHMVRPTQRGGETQSVLTQASYLTSYADKSPYIQELMQPNLQDQLLQTAKAGLAHEKRIVLAKGFYDNGVRVGDRGWIQYQAATAGSLQEQRLPIVVSGFYDPGVIAVGNKCILAPDDVVHLIRTASPIEHFDRTSSMGFYVWHTDLKKTKQLARQIEEKLTNAGISKYWQVTTYHDYEFSKDLMQQFQSDRYLFTLLGLIVLIVACSNIVSFLILLVQDKKREIGILQALGASKKSVAFIFGGCGAAIGLLSSLLGVTAAYLTLQNLGAIVQFLSFLQGHAAFNTAFYGSSLPSDMSLSALTFVLIITPLLSLIAGLIPAWKACRLSPSQILRSE